MNKEKLKKSLLNNLLEDFSRNIVISPEDWNFFESLFELKEFHKGELLIKPGDRPDLVFYLGTGAVKREIHSQDGRVQIISFDGAGRIVSDFVSLIENKKCRIYIQALAQTYSLVGSQDFLKKLRSHNSIWDTNGRVVAEQRYIEKCKREFNLLYYSATERVKIFINEHQDLLKFIPKKDMANFIGITPESLHRIIRTEKINY